MGARYALIAPYWKTYLYINFLFVPPLIEEPEGLLILLDFRAISCVILGGTCRLDHSQNQGHSACSNLGAFMPLRTVEFLIAAFTITSVLTCHYLLSFFPSAFVLCRVHTHSR
eukprot:TRINITY_DN13850_c1_g1_i2.p1 TRINITY_DN13850_c1_g1~~TRINITY_DN13850_c1_g1_i2.p1  ORF type:complete len:113 (+),score=5.06 TRINITY_DN13850_c1_g1_i2:709-1047(+)